jgi:hypothetical protein
MSIPLTIESLYGGGAVERFHFALQEVLQNILDPNTDAKKPRKVKLELTIKPNELRNMADLTISTTTTLCPPAPLETSILIDKDKAGKAHAAEMFNGENPEQNSLPDVPGTTKLTLHRGGANA